MRLTARALPIAALLAATVISAATGQTPAAAPTPAPSAEPTASMAPAARPTPAADAIAPSVPAAITPPALRIKDAPVIAIAKLPAENPFGSSAEASAALPAKLPFAEATVTSGFFVSVHVDSTGKVLAVRRDRDPIPSLVADSLKSMSRWTFTPGRRGGQPVDTWGAYRLDLSVEVRAPKVLQMALTPITPTTPIPAPFGWPPDTEWLESRHAPPPSDGSVPIDQVDTTPFPQKTPWSADSFKGPFTVKFWVHVDKAGKIDRAIPLEVSDPALLPYFRKALGQWVLRPAQSSGQPVETWNELALGGTVSYSDEIKQIVALKKNIGP